MIKAMYEWENVISKYPISSYEDLSKKIGKNISNFMKLVTPNFKMGATDQFSSDLHFFSTFGTSKE